MERCKRPRGTLLLVVMHVMREEDSTFVDICQVQLTQPPNPRIIRGRRDTKQVNNSETISVTEGTPDGEKLRGSDTGESHPSPAGYRMTIG